MWRAFLRPGPDGRLEENDAAFLFKVIGDIARSKGMAQIARELGLNRESLYVAFSPEGNPSFVTVLKVLNVLGFQLSVEPKRDSDLLPLRAPSSP
ncbi:MAG: putative addiction module antidote protein [Treponema sp.]|jgi:probable addiction module antidote protein|nr:putative addiction module antidote protein [Treponema sp.]